MILIFAFSALHAQREISGILTDASDGSFLPGVNVFVKGTTHGTITDANGFYKVEVDEESAILVFSYIGYIKQEIEIGEKSIIDVALKIETNDIEEIVVIGYGTTKKKDLTGSVATINPEDVEGMPVARADLLLQGRASGVEITQNSGAPGGEVRLRIRGVHSINSGNDPLIVIDGFPGGSLSDVNPNDIARLDVLKDASALSIYGARASNGVVLVTTKSGVANKSKIDFSYSKSVQTISKKIDVLSSQDYGYFVNEAYQNDGDIRDYPVIGSRSFPTKPEDIDWNVDWHDQVYVPGEVDEYQLAFSGGGDKTNYYISGNYYDQQGVVPTSTFTRYSARVNLNSEVRKWLTVGINTSVSRKDFIGESGLWNGTGVSNKVLGYSPLFEPKDTLGNWQYDELSIPADNPLASVTIPVPVSELQLDNIISDFFMRFDITDNLSLKTSAGINDINRRHGQAYLQESISGSTKVSPAGNSGQASFSNYQDFRFVNENVLSYDKTFNENHHLSALVGYTWESYSRETYSATGYGFVSDAFMFDYLNMGAADVYSSIGTGKETRQLESYLSRIHYDLFDRYSFTLNGRIDGSSVFAKNQKYGFFPSGAIAWKAHNESFMENLRQLSELKFRVSYGLVGNASIPSYSSLAKMVVTTGTLNNNQAVGVVVPVSVSNDELSWESTKQLDVGLDIGLFRNRITITADYYDKLTDGLLFNQMFPGTSGFYEGMVNIGEVSNKGFEFSLHTINISSPFTWSTDFNISKNINEILSMSDTDFEFVSNATLTTELSLPLNVLQVGQAISTMYGTEYLGVYEDEAEALANSSTLGSAKYAGDIDDNPLFESGNDRKIIGSAFPDFIWGMNNTFSFKGFELGIFIQASHGGDIYNLTRQRLETMNPGSNTTQYAWENRTYYDRGTEEWTFTDIPKVSAYNKMLPTDRFIEDGSFIRLSNINLSYNLPQKWVKHIHVRELKVFVSGQNLAVWTKYSGYDPEVSRYKNSDISHGIDDGTYPNVKGVTFGATVGF